MYLVVGANGFLGSYILKNLLEYTDDEILATATNIEFVNKNERIKWIKCDVTDFDSVKKINDFSENIEELKVVYLASYHHPDKVQENPKLAWDINIVALANFLNSINRVGCFYYASSDVVYGEGDPNIKFNETYKPKPINLYGIHKSTAECIVNAYGFNVVRFPFLIGPSLVSHKEHFYDIIVKTLRSGNTIEMFSDSYRSTLSFDDAAHYLINIMKKHTLQTPKIINIASDDALSKYDVGIFIANKYNFNKSQIIPISINEDSKIFTAKRAKSVLLDNGLMKNILNKRDIKFKV